MVRIRGTFTLKQRKGLEASLSLTHEATMTAPAMSVNAGVGGPVTCCCMSCQQGKELLVAASFPRQPAQ